MVMMVVGIMTTMMMLMMVVVAVVVVVGVAVAVAVGVAVVAAAAADDRPHRNPEHPGILFVRSFEGSASSCAWQGLRRPLCDPRRPRKRPAGDISTLGLRGRGHLLVDCG